MVLRSAISGESACSRLSMEQGPAITAKPRADARAGGKAHHRVFFFHIAAGEFVSFGNADDFRDAGERFQFPRFTSP